ncbi:MAG: alpha/beta hydrolase [Chloroflexi bacterium]|nr:alpha/beta hydrolase [Chloroflexota bacterium]
MRASIEGVEIDYELTGEGPPVVFVHGLGGHKGTWSRQVAPLASRYRVLTFDHRGHGRSTRDVPVTGSAEFVHDLHALLDQLELDRAVLVGHSFGGVLSIRFTLAYPERVRGLVVAASASECNERTHHGWLFRAQLAEEYARSGVPDPLVEIDDFGSASLIADSLRNTSGPIVAAVAREAASLWQEPLTPRLGEITCPALLVVGEKDPIGVGGSVIMQRRIADSKLVVIPRARHYVHRDAPEAFNAALLEFLDHVDAKPRSEAGR